MARRARVVVPGVGHHVVQRGNYRQRVFFEEEDYRVYLALLRKQAWRHGLEVLGWCLMPNHVHLVVRPEREESLSRAVGLTHLGYSVYVNSKGGVSGHLWQNRFYSCPLGQRHFWRALRYVDQNPVRAGMVESAVEYAWSSAAVHVRPDAGVSDGGGLLDLVWWREASRWIDWGAALERSLPGEQVEQLREKTRTGRPLGAEGLVARFEQVVGRRLRALPGGRPKKGVTVPGFLEVGAGEKG